MTNSTSFARRRLVDEVIDHLRTEISSGRLASGSRLPPEPKLTVQLGVSRTTLREAIVVLSHAGLVDVRQGDGTYVKPIAAAETVVAQRSVLELLDAKRPIFIGLIRLAAARRTESEATDLERLATALTVAIDAGKDHELRLATAAVESAICVAAHSDLLADFARQISSSLDAASPVQNNEAEPLSESAAYLVRSARGVIDRDPESADRHIRLWLSARASALAPEQTRMEYVAPEIRRGPRTNHAKRTDVRPGGR
ncbi:MAG TPA: GntR family transcriptional regulator [Gemmatimonadaceae bacterium]|nr:GntR family transcriptional regulator [Gemmatimonadaceae bacterium]